MKRLSCPSTFKILAVIIICLLGLLIYSNTFHSPFHFDDGRSIVRNFSIRNLGDLAAIWDFNPSRFITYLSFALNYHFHRLEVFGYHLVNLVIHLISAILVWWLVLLTFSTPVMKDKEIARHAQLLAFFSGLLFVAHPIQTQAVTYIVQRATSLATLFYLASLCLYVKARLGTNQSPIPNPQSPIPNPQSPAPNPQSPAPSQRRFYYGLSLIAAVLGMLTKQIVFTLPLMIGLYEFSFLRRKKKFTWKYLLPLPLLLIIPLTMTGFRWVALSELGRLTRGTEAISRGHYLLTQFRVLVTYLRLLFIPLNQNLDYDFPLSQTLWELPTLLSFFLLIFILTVAVLLFRRYRLVSFAIFWFFLTLSVESSLIPLRDVIFEHRLYLPSVGYSIFLPVILYYLCRKGKLKLGIAILIAIVSFYSILAHTRNRVWKSEFALWDDTVRKSPGLARPLVNRARALIDLGRFEEAILDSNRALRIEPGRKAAYFNRGTAYANIGEYSKAIADYSQAIRIKPTFAEAHNNRGIVYSRIGEYEKAILDFTQVLKIDPRHTEAYNNRGIVYLRLGEHERAILDFTRILKIDPNKTEAYSNRAVAHFLKKEYDQAWDDVREAQRLGHQVDPKFLEGLRRASGKEE